MTNLLTITSVFAFFLSYLIGVPGCRSYYYSYYSYGDPANTQAKTTVKGDEKLNKLAPKPWAGFEPPEALKKKWSNWLEDYIKQRKLDKKSKLGPKEIKDRGPQSGWPDAWKGLGKGYNGAPPPPWAYVPINNGLPPFCFLPLQTGNCSERLTRYAYNPYLTECVEFQYTGCGENQNNFVKKLKCEESCMKLPVAGCDPDTKQYFDSK